MRLTLGMPSTASLNPIPGWHLTRFWLVPKLQSLVTSWPNLRREKESALKTLTGHTSHWLNGLHGLNGLTAGLLVLCVFSQGLFTVALGQLPHQERFAQSRYNVNQYVEAAAAHMAGQNYLQAIVSYQQAIALNPVASVTAPIYHNMGLAYVKVKAYGPAIASFQRAIRLQPKFHLYYQHLIDAYGHAGVLGEAGDVFQHLTANFPENAEAHYMLGLIYQKQGANSLAQESFQQFLQLEPHSRLSQVARSQLHQLQPPQ